MKAVTLCSDADLPESEIWWSCDTHALLDVVPQALMPAAFLSASATLQLRYSDTAVISIDHSEIGMFALVRSDNVLLINFSCSGHNRHSRDSFHNKDEIT